MGRKVRPALRGLDAMGARLKLIRQQAGLSQMKLAQLIGFAPAHGYKYILRLEKGQVPNPTLRTIAACLEACGAKWQAIVDCLPATGTVAAPAPAQPSTINRMPAAPPPDSSAPQPQIENRKPEVPAPPRRRDSRPMREQLRSRRIEQHNTDTRRFWSRVKRANDETVALLRLLRVPPHLQRAYLSFARACCSALAAFEKARPELAERELARLIPPAVAQGLDHRILTQIQSTCTRVFRSQTGAG